MHEYTLLVSKSYNIIVHVKLAFFALTFILILYVVRFFFWLGCLPLGASTQCLINSFSTGKYFCFVFFYNNDTCYPTQSERHYKKYERKVKVQSQIVLCTHFLKFYLFIFYIAGLLIIINQ